MTQELKELIIAIEKRNEGYKKALNNSYNIATEARISELNAVSIMLNKLPAPPVSREVKPLSEISDEHAIEVAKIIVQHFEAIEFTCNLINVDEKYKTLELIPSDYHKGLKMPIVQIDFKLNGDIVLWSMHAKSPWSMHESDEAVNYHLPLYLKSVDYLRQFYYIPNAYASAYPINGDVEKIVRDEAEWLKLRDAIYEIGTVPDHYTATRIMETVKQHFMSLPNGEKWDAAKVEAFMVWKYENRWFNLEDGLWCYTFEHGTSMSGATYRKNYMKTTKELIEMWEKSLPSPPKQSN